MSILDKEPLRPFMKIEICTEQNIETNHRVIVGGAAYAFTTGIVTALASDKDLISRIFGEGVTAS